MKMENFGGEGFSGMLTERESENLVTAADSVLAQPKLRHGFHSPLTY